MAAYFKYKSELSEAHWKDKNNKIECEWQDQRGRCKKNAASDRQRETKSWEGIEVEKPAKQLSFNCWKHKFELGWQWNVETVLLLMRWRSQVQRKHQTRTSRKHYLANRSNHHAKPSNERTKPSTDQPPKKLSKREIEPRLIKHPRDIAFSTKPAIIKLGMTKSPETPKWTKQTNNTSSQCLHILSTPDHDIIICCCPRAKTPKRRWRRKAREWLRKCEKNENNNH